jgi:hypothetical protein
MGQDSSLKDSIASLAFGIGMGHVHCGGRRIGMIFSLIYLIALSLHGTSHTGLFMHPQIHIMARDKLLIFFAAIVVWWSLVRAYTVR